MFLAGLNPPSGEIRELGVDEVEACGHQVVEDPALQAERRPVEIVMRDEPFVLFTAGACEEDLEDRGMRGAGKPFELPKRGQCDTRLSPCRAREGEPSRQSVVHGVFL